MKALNIDDIKTLIEAAEVEGLIGDKYEVARAARDLGHFPTLTEAQFWVQSRTWFKKLDCYNVEWGIYVAEGYPLDAGRVRDVELYSAECRKKRNDYLWEEESFQKGLEYFPNLEGLPEWLRISPIRLWEDLEHNTSHTLLELTGDEWYRVWKEFGSTPTTPSEIRMFLLTGKRGYKVYNPEWAETASYMEGFTPEYWDGMLSPQGLLKAGVNLQCILDVAGGICSQLGDLFTERQLKRTLLRDECLIDFWVIIDNFFPGWESKIKLSPWEVDDILVWAWALEHPKWVESSREVHGPGGQAGILHHHTLVSKMTSDMLPQGVKTSPRVVEAALERVAQEEIDKLLRENEPLPEIGLSKPLPEGVVQITTTWGLKSEGNVMNHCVGGYIKACQNKRSFIFHVDDGTDLGATVEVCPGPWRVVQAMGYNNTPSKVAKQVVEQHVLPYINE